MDVDSAGEPPQKPGPKPGEEQSADSVRHVWWLSGATWVSMNLEGEVGRNVLLLCWLAAFFLCISAPPTKEQRQEAFDGLLFFWLWAQLQLAGG